MEGLKWLVVPLKTSLSHNPINIDHIRVPTNWFESHEFHLLNQSLAACNPAAIIISYQSCTQSKYHFSQGRKVKQYLLLFIKFHLTLRSKFTWTCTGFWDWGQGFFSPKFGGRVKCCQGIFNGAITSWDREPPVFNSAAPSFGTCDRTFHGPVFR